jgi:hypothetical protein
LAGEAFLQSPAQRERLQVRCGADQLIGVRILGEFDESQRVASRLSNYPIRDLTIAAKP